MGEEDTRRQALNVARMRLLGAEVVPVTIGTRTLKDAINEALRDWVTNVETTHYLLGTVTGPHPFPEMVREFHRIIGEEAREQMLERVGTLRGSPAVPPACCTGRARTSCRTTTARRCPATPCRQGSTTRASAPRTRG